MTQKFILNPVFETTINKAIFTNQDIIVYPRDIPLPKDVENVIQFLFGKGACLEQDVTNSQSMLRIKNASYVLKDVKTINADWTYKEIEQ